MMEQFLIHDAAICLRIFFFFFLHGLGVLHAVLIRTFRIV